jgi:hypothetical protein
MLGCRQDNPLFELDKVPADGGIFAEAQFFAHYPLPSSYIIRFHLYIILSIFIYFPLPSLYYSLPSLYIIPFLLYIFLLGPGYALLENVTAHLNVIPEFLQCVQ